MNPESDPRSDDDERQVAELLGMLKSIRPAFEGQVEIRKTVAQELAAIRLVTAGSTGSALGRTSSVWPPFVLGAALGALATIVMMVRPFSKEDLQPGAALQLPSKSAAGKPRDTAVLRDSPVEQPVFDRYYTATYLCGVGAISTTSLDVLREEPK